MTPEQLAGTSEHSQQRAFFAWAAMAQRHGFNAAWDDRCYKEAGWAQRNYGNFEAQPDLAWIHAIKNQEKGGGDAKTNAIRGLANKAEGVKPGVADIFWPKPIINWQNSPPSPDPPVWYHGLYIEMKKLKGGVKDDKQIEFANFVSGKGYAHRFAVGWLQAAKVCHAYGTEQLAQGVLVD